MVRIALVGDRNDAVVAHRAIPLALQLAASACGIEAEWTWHATRTITPGVLRDLERADGIWCVPASPYESEAGALAAIRLAREAGIPFLGTCGGCQHAILEFARNALGLQNAEHAETSPGAALPLIAPLACALVEQSAPILLLPGTRIRALYGRERIEEGYHCSFGLNPRLEHLLIGSDLEISGRSPEGEARSLELKGHPFFVLTQFQPERGALRGEVPPPVAGFVSRAASGS